MIVQFKFRNFKSFKDETILDMTPVNGFKELEQNIHTIESDYINIKESKNRLLKVAAINGQNASGKSNLIDAFKFFKNKVVENSVDKEIKNVKVPHFLFSVEKLSSEFEITFIKKGIKYRYGFELDENEILKEWLYISDKGVEKKYYERKNNKIELGNKRNIEDSYVKMAEKSLAEKKDTLVLSLLYNRFGAVGKDGMLKNVYKYIEVNITIVNRVDKILLNVLAEGIKKQDRVFLDIFENVKLFVKAMDVRIKDIIPFKDSKESYPFYAIHNCQLRDGNYKSEPIPFVDESEGTKKLFSIAPLLFLTLRKEERVMIVDELDNKIHTNLFIEIIKLFQKSKSQFIFATHNPYIMEHDLLRRDQIYFVDKNEYEESELYSLSDFQGVKTTDSYQKRYLNGNYGAVPIIDFSELEKSLFGKNDDKYRDDE